MQPHAFSGFQAVLNGAVKQIERQDTLTRPLYPRLPLVVRYFPVMWPS